MNLREKLFITLKGYYPSAPDVRHEFVSNEILSLLGENEIGVSGSQDKHGDLPLVSESNASTSGEPEHGTLEKITDSENFWCHQLVVDNSIFNGGTRCKKQCEWCRDNQGMYES